MKAGNCPCSCHGRFEAPCTIEGGCGHLHKAPVLERPASACRACKPPKGTRPWKLAERGYFACEQCGDEMANNLVEIGQRYYLLNPAPAGRGGDDGMPGVLGFESKSPGSDHIIVMRDHRSTDQAKVWVGGDGRVHRESETPPLSVYAVLLLEAVDTAERRGFTETVDFETVAELTVFLERHVPWWVRQEDVGEFADKLRALVRQLRPVTGTPKPRSFVRCPEVIPYGEDDARTCGGPVYPPETLANPIMVCGECGKSWDRSNWEQLGAQIRSA